MVACMKMPRAKLLPVEVQSIQLTVYSMFWLSREREEFVDAVELDALDIDLAPDDGLKPEAAPM